MAAFFQKFVPGIHIPSSLLTQMEIIDRIEDKAERKSKTWKLNVEYFAEFIRELRKTTNAAGCHIMAVGFEDIVKEIIAAADLRA